MNPMNYAWVVMKRWQPEDEDTYEGASYCEKCNRKLRAGNVDTHMCNRCIRQDEGGSFPPIPPEDKDLNKLLKQFGPPDNPYGQGPWPPAGQGHPQSPFKMPQAEEKQEEPKPLYDQKQQLAIAHQKLSEIRMLMEQIAQGDTSPETLQRIGYDLDELNRIIEDALSGEGPMPENGGAAYG